MSAASGSPTQNRTSVATPQDLAGVPDDQFLNGDMALVESLRPAGTFQLNRQSSAVADNVTVIDTFSGNGQWLLFPGAGSWAPLVVENVAALAGLSANLLDNTVAWIESFRTYLRLDRTDAQVPDNLTVMAAVGGGNWLRDLSYGDETWSSAANWEIDAVTGDDENTGRPGSPLQTFAELARRLTGTTIPIITTVTVLSNIPNTDRPQFSDLPPESVITVIGDTTVRGVGAITAVQAISRATNDALEIEAAALGGTWTALGYVRLLLRITAGPRAGAIAWVMQDLGGGNNRARLTAMASPGSTFAGTAVTPQVGDEFEILEEFFVIADHVGVHDPIYKTKVLFQYLHFTEPTFTYPIGAGLNGYVFFWACKINDYIEMTGASVTYFVACIFPSVGAGGTFALPELYEAATARFSFCGFLEGWAFPKLYSSRAWLRVDNDTLFVLGAGIYADSNGGTIETNNVAFFDNTNDCMWVSLGCNIRLRGHLYGEGNTQQILILGSWAHGVYDTLANLVVTSAAAVLQFGVSAPVAWAALPFVDNALPADSQAGLIAKT